MVTQKPPGSLASQPWTGQQRAVEQSAARLLAWNSPVTSYYVLTGATALLVVLGLVMVLSSSSVESLAAGRSPYAVFFSQAQYALMGLPVLWVASRLPTSLYKKAAWPLLGLAALLQLAVFSPLGADAVGGNRNWIAIGSLSMQPSEAVKLALSLWLGVVLARKRPLLSEWKHALIPALPVGGLMIGLVLLGHDLGTALVMMLLVGGAMFIAGVPLRMFSVAVGMAVLAAGMLAITSQNRVARIFAWLSDDCDPTSDCYQTLHGGWGLATGGWTGIGLGASREKWSYLPEAHNDFIFAILGEELGLVGTLLVLGLIALIALAMFRVIRRHQDPFVQIATGAIVCWVIGQALVNIAVVIGLAPVIGVPLPLVSAGGSALITTMAAIGVVMSFARGEPGAPEALAARPSVVRRSLAVIGRTRG
ncbi:putative lipid II flippase FtsW [Cellulomonas chengniuliangii]|uniref:Probable peptidoglycan glycosyltransferase FtsW n=1 Tax=Cellulomonas chengniuliangii TaxID=2968084 RepID=A0ABY5KWN8_9CELL|nr:putative lipid II flippase FtsW [Cellulomonas chengniuliangii]MCC2310225.1 putative lipid II flippase FtsW [Cellulomonas chengniuliangii]MCC2319150.1 putative lipid II flippase FtsW [Cellulomonas chengniuliangii]UUI74118.1 putative lipid II flippase FtsW [Cellulomonas chengniuliangii]